MANKCNNDNAMRSASGIEPSRGHPTSLNIAHHTAKTGSGIRDFLKKVDFFDGIQEYEDRYSPVLGCGVVPQKRKVTPRAV